MKRLRFLFLKLCKSLGGFFACLALACCAHPPHDSPAGMQLVRFPYEGSNHQVYGYYMFEPGAPKPAVVILPGSEGLWDNNGRIGYSYNWFARFFRKKGFQVLAVDSLTSHGISPYSCEAPLRIGDAQGAVRWLKQREEVRPDKIVYVGLSDGGATVLGAINASPRETSPAAAIVLYPICGPFVHEYDSRWKASYPSLFETKVPLYIGIGELDNCIILEHCNRLAERISVHSLDFTYKLYPDAGHGFFPTRRTGIWLKNMSSYVGGPNPTVRGAKNGNTKKLVLRDLQDFLNQYVTNSHASKDNATK